MGEGGCEDGLRHSCALLGSAPTHGRCSWLLVFKSAKFLFNSFPFQSPSLILFLIASDIPHPILQTCFMRLVSLSPDVPVFFGFSVACSRDDNPFVVWDAYSPPPRSHPRKKSISVSRSRWNRHISSPMEYSPSCFSTPHSPSSSPLSSKKLPHLCPHRQQQEVGVWCQGTLLNTEACPLALTFSKAWLLSCALLGQGGGSREQPCIFPFIFPGTLKWAT